MFPSGPVATESGRSPETNGGEKVVTAPLLVLIRKITPASPPEYQGSPSGPSVAIWNVSSLLKVLPPGNSLMLPALVIRPTCAGDDKHANQTLLSFALTRPTGVHVDVSLNSVNLRVAITNLTTELSLDSPNHKLPSAPVAIVPTWFGVANPAGYANSVMTPPVVIVPRCADSGNHTLPSGPRAISPNCVLSPLGVVKDWTDPDVVTRTIFDDSLST